MSDIARYRVVRNQVDSRGRPTGVMHTFKSNLDFVDALWWVGFYNADMAPDEPRPMAILEREE